jgi:prepilin-type N-terminal cleavage/methylation domain-containing protein
MQHDAGYTLIELLVAAALMLLLTAVACHVLVEARATIDVSAERADLQQRGRVALHALSSRLRGAGAGPDRGVAAGRLVRWAPPIWPGSPAGAPTDFSTAVTTLEVLSSVPPATLAFDAPAGTGTLDFEYAPGCPAPCGFFERMTVLVADGLGDFDVFAVAAIDAGSATVRRLHIGTDSSYARGSPALPVDLRTYYFDNSKRELRAFDGDRSDMPVVNDVVALSFEYVAEASDGTLEALDAGVLQDGPWRGIGIQPYDADLLRIRAVRVSIRLQAGSVACRGADPRWFLNPGTAVETLRLVRDISMHTYVTSFNLGGWR